MLLLLFMQPTSEAGERLARLEAQVVSLRDDIGRLESKVDILSAQQVPADSWITSTHGATWLLAALIALDKAGYYIRRKNGQKNLPPKGES